MKFFSFYISVLRGLGNVGFTAGLMASIVTPAVAAISPERSVYIQLMDAPDNIDLNLKYARLTYKSGKVERTKKALERIFLVDPDNTEAKALLNQIMNKTPDASGGDRLRLSLQLDVTYENNAPRRDPSFSSYEDQTAKAALIANDKRTISGRQWETKAVALKYAHNKWNNGDLLYLSLSSGPVYSMDQNSSLRLAPVISYAQTGTRTLYHSAGVVGTYKVSDTSPFSEAGFSASYDQYKKQFKEFRGPTVTLYSKYLWDGTHTAGDRITIRPEFIYRQGTGDSGSKSYTGIALKAGYSYPLDKMITGYASLKVSGRLYDGRDADETSISYRQDIKSEPEVGFRWKDALPNNGNLSGRINYISNYSNDTDKKYRGYLIGVSSQWQF